MKREAYDRVQKHMQRTGETRVGKALKATKINAGTYYRQKGLVEQSPEPTYELTTLQGPGPGPEQFFPVKSGIVALVGAPADLAELLARLGGAR